LSWAGAKPVEQPYIFIGQAATVYFFTFFFILVPVLGRLESFLLWGNQVNNQLSKISKKY
jgi:ubiquinol-cytochrome c reductase cytochrome b subunit